MINTSPPLISVVMSLYNSERYLEEAIDSILAQTLTDFEFIIIDDGSTDDGEHIVRSYDDGRIHYIKQENVGLPAALNTAIGIAQSDLIARMDPDDVCMPERLQRQYEFMRHHADVVVLGTSAQLMDVDGNDICVLTMQSADAELRRKSPDSPFVHPSVVFRKDAFERVGGYPGVMRLGGEDAVLFGRMATCGKLHNFQEVLLKYRLRPGALSRKSAKFRALLKKTISDGIIGEHDDQTFSRLIRMANSTSSAEASYDYHFEVAKLYLWSGQGLNSSRLHSRKCISIKPTAMKGWLLYFLGWLPAGLIGNVYFLVKHRSFGSSSQHD